MLSPPRSITLHSSLYYYISDFFSVAFFGRTQDSPAMPTPHPFPTSQKEKELGEEKEVSLYKQIHTGKEKQTEREGILILEIVEGMIHTETT